MMLHSNTRQQQTTEQRGRNILLFQRLHCEDDWNQACVISPRQNSHKVAGAGGVEEGPNIPETALKHLQLHTSADPQNLLDLDFAAKHRNVGVNVLKYRRITGGYNPDFRPDGTRTRSVSGDCLWRRRCATCPAPERSYSGTRSSRGERSRCCISARGTSPRRRTRGFSGSSRSRSEHL